MNLRTFAVALAALPVILLASCSDDKKNEPPAPVVEVVTIQLNPATVNLEPGKEATLTATIAPDDATDKTLKWSSADASVAEVDAKGIVRAKAQGTTTVTATASNGVKGTATVTVFDPTDIPIPDAKLKASILKQMDHAQPDKISLEEAKVVRNIYCGNEEIESLEGIQFFENLTGLGCGNNALTKLDVSSLTKLTYLDCHDNPLLAELTLGDLPNLETFLSNNTLLSKLDISHFANLTRLDCGSKSLAELTFGEMPNLTDFFLYGSAFSKLDVSGLTGLEVLGIEENHSLTELTLGNLPKITDLSFENTVFAKLDISGLTGLEVLKIEGNHSLTELNLDNSPKISTLSLIDTVLTKLDISGLTGLNFLTCRNNSLLTELWFQDKAQRDKVSLNIDSEDIIRYHNE
ncbi:MAG: Ig-like domain-containing protein [Mediterranea sp.]|nr:Ig-like domain-containing protein [Mediterranea sp.]